jgi:hypothetical protein
MKKLDIVHDDGETMYLTNGKEYYALEYYYMPKEELRDFADVKPDYVYKDEDGDTCYEYDDDCWDVDSEIVKNYIDDYIERGYKIYESGDHPSVVDGDIFKVYKNDNGWYETLEQYLKK